MKTIIFAMGMLLLFSGGGRSKVPVKGPVETNAVNGTYWETLSTRTSEGSLLLYTSGYVSGYDYALSQVLAALQKQPYSQKDLAAFITLLKFPDQFTNTEIKRQIDLFYQNKKNQNLPLFVAFTLARQKIQGYPKSYSEAYIVKMRKLYAEKD